MKSLSKNDLMRIAGVSGRHSRTVLWHTTNITIRQFLPLNEYCALIQQIIDLCYDDEGNWQPHIVDFTAKACIMNAYIDMEMPESIEDQFYIVYGTDLFETLCKFACKDQIDSIINSVNLK